MLTADDGRSATWTDPCHRAAMFLDIELSQRLKSIRISHADWLAGDCGPLKRSKWRTDKNLALGDPTKRVQALYGEPDSRIPSTNGRQQLELLYYAFDWAGPNVPQIMTVLCTPEKEGKPGQVVEITLEAASL